MKSVAGQFTQLESTLLTEAAQQLTQGELVAFPTETVYGLGADAENPQAVAKIYAAKGRPQDHPVIVHLAQGASLTHWATDIPQTAYVLIEAYWPGPLTLILKRNPAIPDAVSKGANTIGLRCPAHPMAQALLSQFRHGQGGVAAPSANRFGRISPTTAGHVRDEFGDDLMILDGGACEVGIESTIVDLTNMPPVLLRPGQISKADLESKLGIHILSKAEVEAKGEQAQAHSGSLAAHYAPRTSMAVLDAASLANEAAQLIGQGKRVGVLVRNAINSNVGQQIVLSDDPAHYAHDFYAALRTLDRLQFDMILVQALPDNEAWQGVADRLGRAAVGAGK